MKCYQQGDVFIEPTKVPKGADFKPVTVLAEGEVTGHAHRTNIPVMLAVIGGERFVQVTEPTELTHEEHGPITIEPGIYRQRVVREYDHFAEEAREVRD